MMDEPCSSNTLPPFLTKTYEMVDDPSTNSTVSWSSNDRSFIVWNPPDFARDLLPKYFKHNNFSSFIRQLNTYGFRKVDPELWEFANEDFVRGQPQLLKNIHRRKPVHSHSGPGILQSPLIELERQGYKDDIERLKSDKESLNLELHRHKQEQEALDCQVQSMTERIQHVEQRQKDIVSFLSRTLQKPMLALNLMQQNDMHNRKRRLPGSNYLTEDISTEENQIAPSHVLSRENLSMASLLAFNKDLLDQLDFSLAFWEKLLLDVRQTWEKHNSSPVLDESTSCAESPAFSYTQLNVHGVDVGAKNSGIDMNSGPNAALVTENAPTEEQIAVNSTKTPTGVNDVFWEQFLTENPGSADASEVQSKRKDTDNRKNESNPVDHEKFWWNMRRLNNLGHLTPAERT